MSYISGKQIVEKYLKFNPKLFDREKQEQQIGVDLTVDTINEVNSKEMPNIEGIFNDKTYLPEYNEFVNDIFTLPTSLEGKIIFQLEANSIYSITFNEGCKLDDNSGGFIKGRSSLIRMGCLIESGMYDPGFEVEQMGCILHTPNYPIIIEKNSRIAQLVLQTTNEKIINIYDGQFKGDKDAK